MSTDTTTICRDTLATTVYDGPYAALRDRRLAARLAAEDVAEEAGVDPFERVSCRLHQRWLHQCVSSPVHVVAFTGHRWCRTCAARRTSPSTSGWGTSGSPARVVAQHRAAARPGSSSARVWPAWPLHRTGDPARGVRAARP